MNAMLGCKAPVSLDDLVCWDASAALEGVDILGEACVEVLLLGEETYEGVRQGTSRAEFTGSELVCEGVDWKVCFE